MSLDYVRFTSSFFTQCLACRGSLLAALLLGAGFGSHAQAPANDDCATAQLLSIGPACVAMVVNTAQATASPAGLPSGTCSISNTPDVWYRVVVPAGGGVSIRTSAAAGSATTSSILDAYTGTCGGLLPLACDRTTDANGNPAFSALTLRNLVPGSTVYIRPRVNNLGTVMTGSFTLCVQEPTATAARAAWAGALPALYPNPAPGRATLALPALPGQSAATVTLLDALGQTVQTRTVALAAGGTTVALELGTLRAGLYAVRVRAGQHTATQQLVVQ